VITRLLILFPLTLAACSFKTAAPHIKTPQTEPERTRPVATSHAVKSHQEQERRPLAYHHTSRNGIVLTLVSFDDRQHQLQVADQTKGPGSHWSDSHSAAVASRGVAAINGGFFTPEGKPLGLVISHGVRRGHVNQSSLGSGVYFSSSKKKGIVRRETYLKTSNQLGKVHHLLQTGPMLTENQAPISGLSKSQQRPRSFIAWDGQHHWAIGLAEPCTLNALSHALAGKAPGGFTIRSAVNLDGGRSSDLWAGPAVIDGGKTHRGFFNKPVRNFLIVVPR
jgi:uncharacterized protein YigE (DUF2233 family)